MIKILVADDHPVIRKGLVAILARRLGDVICGEATNGNEVLEAVEREHWDVAILDISMPGRSGLEILPELRRLRPKLPVLVLSVHSEEQYGKRALKAGASGYMGKGSAPEELIGAIRKLLAGRRYLSPALAETLAVNSLRNNHGERSPHERLSDRELEILRLIGAGRSVTQIAEELHLAASTISTHRAHILTKMNMTTTAELIRYAVNTHLTD